MTKEDLVKEELLHKTFDQSQKRLTQVRSNRRVDDIPLSDDYWVVLQFHQQKWNKK